MARIDQWDDLFMRLCNLRRYTFFFIVTAVSYETGYGRVFVVFFLEKGLEEFQVFQT